MLLDWTCCVSDLQKKKKRYKRIALSSNMIFSEYVTATLAVCNYLMFSSHLRVIAGQIVAVSS